MPHMLGQLGADRQDRVQGGGGILRHHRDATTADCPKLGAPKAEQFGAFQPDRAAHPRARRQQAEQRQRGQSLPAAALARDTHDFAATHSEGDAIDCLLVTRPGRQLDRQPVPGGPWVEHVTKGVADEVEGEHDGQDRQPREHADPPVAEVQRAFCHHGTPLGSGWLGAEAEERQS